MNGDERSRLASRKLIEAHEAERTRIARELHDDIGQRLAVLTMDLDILDRALPAGADEVHRQLRALSDRTLALAKDIQAISHRLHPSKLDHLGVAAAAAAFCRETAKRTGVDIAFSADAVPDGIPAEITLALFRILQEAVTNAVAHAGVRQVTVALRRTPGELGCEVADAGVGFELDAALNGRGAGLVGMQERARLIGGELQIETHPGTGTSVRLRIRN